MAGHGKRKTKFASAKDSLLSSFIYCFYFAKGTGRGPPGQPTVSALMLFALFLFTCFCCCLLGSSSLHIFDMAGKTLEAGPQREEDPAGHAEVPVIGSLGPAVAEFHASQLVLVSHFLSGRERKIENGKGGGDSFTTCCSRAAREFRLVREKHSESEGSRGLPSSFVI